MTNSTTTPTFSPYQKFVIAILAITQFTIVLDFMVLNPLLPFISKDMSITPKQFSWVVSAYAFSAGAAGLLSSFIADRFDRKRLFVVFYIGFIVGTLFCGLASTYHQLLAARTVAGIFGGVMGSTAAAIITDVFAFEQRGRVMGFFQMAFASSQVLGLPIGLALANEWGWNSTFLAIVGICIPILLAIVFLLRPIDSHLSLKRSSSAGVHMARVATDRRYLQVFLATTLLATGGFMLMPFGAAFAVGNLGLTMEQLPFIYFVTGLCSMAAGPLVGKLADRLGAYKVFVVGSLTTIISVLIYTNLGITPVWAVTLLSAVMMSAVGSRMITASALTSAVPDPADRGAFMGINSSVAQVSGGIAAAVAGMIVVERADGFLENYPLLGIVVAAAMFITGVQLYFVNRAVRERRKKVVEGNVEITK